MTTTGNINTDHKNSYVNSPARPNGTAQEIFAGNSLEFGESLQLRKDTSQSGRIIYGYAKPGEATDEAVWLIYADDTSGDDFSRVFAELASVQTADFVHIWDDRLTILPMAPAAANEYSVKLNGVNEYLDGGDIFQFEHSDAFTISMWIKPANIAANRILFSKTGPAAAVDGYMLRHNATTGALFLQMRTTTVDRSFAFSSALTASVWQLMTFTYDGSSNINGARTYINDTVGSTPTSGALSGTMLGGWDFFIGQRNGTFFLNANVDHVTVWDKNLNQTEVTELYNAGVTFNPTTHSANTNLLSWYRMGDGDTHPTITDNKGSNDLTMVNMAAGNFVSDVP